MRTAFLLAVPIFLAGCPTTPQGSQPPQAPTGAAAQAAPGVPASAPAAAGQAAAGAAGSVKGKVLERVNAAGYTYLKLQTEAGEAWAAVMENPVEVGAEVTVTDAMPMDGFESKALGRKFDKIYFGSLGGGPAAQAPGGEAASQPGAAAATGAGEVAHGPTATPPADMGPIKVEKAKGADAYTVAELIAKKAELKDKTVTIRGKVVKFTGGVMGNNWIHLRDGTGTDAAKDNDITVTTQDTAAVGDVVTVKGAVHLDKDFGAGYAYAVIIEGAKVTK